MPTFKEFHYGVCYYPEHWPAKRHAEDIARIADAGFTLVRMGEGAWGYWEPEEGRYQFELFDRVIDLCRKHNVRVIMGTPTYCAPAWVATKYPEVLRWDFRRTPMAHGSRRNFNYTSQRYYDLSDRLCTALAGHYKGEKQIIGWQLDNEFNCHMDVSYAPSDTVAFRAWLKKRYKTLDRLNAAWGTAFWSQQYDDWNQIDLPAPTSASPNPTQFLDESRFISDCVVAFASRQADILRAANPKWLITHNLHFANIHGPDLAKVLDFYSHDHYPRFWKPSEWTIGAENLARARALSFPFGVLEQQSGPGGQLTYLHETPRPGQMRLWAFQSVAHGSKILEYFRWRTCPYGAEQHWHGILDADNRDNRRLREAKETGHDFAKLPAAFFDAPVEATVGILHDYDNDINDNRINTYTREGRGEASRWMATFARRHVGTNLLWPESSFAGHRLLVAPHLKIMDKDLAAKLEAFVRAGGTLVLGAQSGLKDRNAHIVEMPLPGLFRKLAGVEVEEWTALPQGETREARLPDGRSVLLNTFVERLKPRGAEVRARWTGSDPLLSGAPAITRHAVGKGYVIYIGGYAPAEAISTFVNGFIQTMRLPVLAQAADDIEILARRDGKRRWLVLLNHAATPRTVDNLPKGKDLLTDNAVSDGSLTLPGYGVAVIAA